MKNLKKFKNFVLGASSVVLFSGAVALLENNVFGDIEYEYQDVTLVLPKDGSFEDHRFCKNNEIAEEYIMTLGASTDSFDVIKGVELTKATGDGEINIPNEIDNKPVLKLGKELFKNNKSITGEVVIPKNVVIIGQECFFECTKLAGLSFEPNSQLRVIGTGAFQYCINMRGSLILPDELSVINESAFEQCGFDGELKLNDKLSTILKKAFCDCGGFDCELTIPASLNEIQSEVFKSAKLKCVEFSEDNKLKRIAEGLFAESLVDEASALSLPNTVSWIAPEAFRGCNFNKVTLSDDLEIISQESFRDAALGSVVIIPNKVKTIGDYAFNGSRVRVFVFRCNETLETLGEECFKEIENLMIVNLPSDKISEDYFDDTTVFVAVDDKNIDEVINYLTEYDWPVDDDDQYFSEELRDGIVEKLEKDYNATVFKFDNNEDD